MLRLAKQGVYKSIQGEGYLCGVPMTFIRLAGCSVGCPQCDTNYTETRTASVEVATTEIFESDPTWVWITGGEPTDQDNLEELISTLRTGGRLVALASAGIRECPVVDWLSISPHSANVPKCEPDELKVILGLNGLTKSDADKLLSCIDARHKYVGFVSKEWRQDAIDIVDQRTDVRLSWQAHKQWGLS